MKRPLVNILIFVLILAGLFMVSGRVSQVAQASIGSRYYLNEEPNDPDPELALSLNQIIWLNEEPNEPNDPE